MVHLSLRPLRISAISAFNGYFNAEYAEIRRGPQRKTDFKLHFLCKAFSQQKSTSRSSCTASDERTREGANQTVVVVLPGKYRQLAGVVEGANGEILSLIAAAKQKASKQRLEITLEPGT